MLILFSIFEITDLLSGCEPSAFLYDSVCNAIAFAYNTRNVILNADVLFLLSRYVPEEKILEFLLLYFDVIAFNVSTPFNSTSSSSENNRLDNSPDNPTLSNASRPSLYDVAFSSDMPSQLALSISYCRLLSIAQLRCDIHN